MVKGDGIQQLEDLSWGSWDISGVKKKFTSEKKRVKCIKIEVSPILIPLKKLKFPRDDEEWEG